MQLSKDFNSSCKIKAQERCTVSLKRFFVFRGTDVCDVCVDWQIQLTRMLGLLDVAVYRSIYITTTDYSIYITIV